MALEYAIRPISVAEYHRMADEGYFRDGERVELIDGQLIKMPPIGDDHVLAHESIVAHINRQFEGVLRACGMISVVLDDFNEPQPDVVAFLADGRPLTSVPGLDRAAFYVEIAKTSRRFDLGRKADLYAAAGIMQYFVADLVNDVVIDLRDPQPTRGYVARREFRRGQSIDLVRVPGASILADKFLGERATS